MVQGKLQGQFRHMALGKIIGAISAKKKCLLHIVVNVKYARLAEEMDIDDVNYRSAIIKIYV